MAKAIEMTELKRGNRATAFSMILESQRLTRSEICGRTGLSTPTVMKIFEFFERKRLIVQTEQHASASTVGRKPILYRVNGQENQMLSILYEGDTCQIGFVSLDGAILDTAVCACTDDMARFMQGELFTILKKHIQKRPSYVKCIGVALPAIVQKNEISYAPYLGISKPFPLEDIRSRIQRQFNLPVIFENDVNAAAIGEFGCRRQDNIRNMAYIGLNHGVGSGLILNRKLYRGSHSFSGEIGYMNTDIHGFSSFSQHGALEGRLDQQTISRRWPMTAHSPDEVRDMVNYMADHLALAMSNMQCILDLDLFVLGGERIPIQNDLLTEAVNTRLKYLGEGSVLCFGQKCAHPELLGTAKLSQEAWLNELFCEE